MRDWERRCVQGMAPEILSFLDGGSQFDEQRSDIFALGVLFFSAIFLRAPVEGEKANENDAYFKYMHERNYKRFWKIDDFQCVMNILKQQVKNNLS